MLLCYSFLLLCSFYVYGDHQALHVLTLSFPTRRSSDLRRSGASSARRPAASPCRDRRSGSRGRSSARRRHPPMPASRCPCFRAAARRRGTKSRGPSPWSVHDPPASRERNDIRSEEHTSELQSLMRISYAVFCLKKKTKSHNNKTTNIIDNQHQR